MRHMENRKAILKRLQRMLTTDPFWSGVLADVDALTRIHLAIFKEPYLQFIADGKKTIETRFSQKKFPPYDAIDKGDIMLLKRSGGPVVGLCLVDQTWFYQLDADSLDLIREKFGAAICPEDESFWDARAEALFASLIWVSHFSPLDPFTVAKTDRRGWVVFHD